MVQLIESVTALVWDRFGNFMLKRETALQIRKKSLNAISELNSILSDIQNDCPEADFNLIKRGAGFSMGRTQIEILEVINNQYPEIDDLKA